VNVPTLADMAAAFVKLNNSTALSAAAGQDTAMNSAETGMVTLANITLTYDQVVAQQ
jgi:hypothetical protein